MFKKKNSKEANTRERRTAERQITNTFSYYSSSKNEPNTTRTLDRIEKPRSHKSNRQLSANHIPTYISIILIVFSVLYATTLNTKPKVLLGSIVNNDSTLLRSQVTYENGIQSILDQSLLNRSKVTIDTSSIAKSIVNMYPEIDKAVVTIPFIGRRPIVGLQPAEPTIIIVGKTNSFVVGQDGRALVKTSDLAPGNHNNLPVVEDDSGIILEQGKPVIPKQTVEFITTVIQQLKLKNLTVSSLILPSIANELHIKVDGQPYIIKFNLASDPRQQVGTFLATKAKLEKDKITPLDYIDVRVEERSFYK